MLCGARKPGTCIRLSVKQGETAVVSPKLPAKTQESIQIICKVGRNSAGSLRIATKVQTVHTTTVFGRGHNRDE